MLCYIMQAQAKLGEGNMPANFVSGTVASGTEPVNN